MPGPPRILMHLPLPSPCSCALLSLRSLLSLVPYSIFFPKGQLGRLPRQTRFGSQATGLRWSLGKLQVTREGKPRRVSLPVLILYHPAGSPSCCSACPHCAPSGSSAWSTCSSSSSSGTRPLTPSSWRCWRPRIKPPRPLPPVRRSCALPGHSCSAPALSLPFLLAHVDLWGAVSYGLKRCVTILVVFVTACLWPRAMARAG